MSSRKPPPDRRVFGPGPYLLRVGPAGRTTRTARAPLLPRAAWMAPIELDLSAPVTFFVGENGTGKSTTLEAIAVAVAAGFNVEGGPLSAELEQHGLRARPPVAEAHGQWIVELSTFKPQLGFFLRAESFFNVARGIDALDGGLYGEQPLHEQSHGESFGAGAP